ncbi:hypothetical protein [Paraburkholderia aromaticivorans]|uniref:hypothetical protein n=1 Tax=Paraburkholderia aromaticivorans TaxID=2026199 RepID=UPI0014561403|nr:hypothetical protein [Paraburkholderia aromaticivorans]
MDEDKITFAPAHRWRFIDFLLAEYGTINLSAICPFFALSMPQASHDFAKYQQIASHNTEYDKTSKTYGRTRELGRAFP